MDEFGRVLVIGVKHDYNIPAKCNSFIVTGFLVSAVAFVIIMLNNMPDPDLPAYFDGIIAAVVVNQNNFVNNVEWDLLCMVLTISPLLFST